MGFCEDKIRCKELYIDKKVNRFFICSNTHAVWHYNEPKKKWQMSNELNSFKLDLSTSYGCMRHEPKNTYRSALQQQLQLSMEVKLTIQTSIYVQ